MLVSFTYKSAFPVRLQIRWREFKPRKPGHARDGRASTNLGLIKAAHALGDSVFNEDGLTALGVAAWSGGREQIKVQGGMNAGVPPLRA